jgi:subtilisin family serine protease
MGWSRSTWRSARCHRKPQIETLEGRTLLSAIPRSLGNATRPRSANPTLLYDHPRPTDSSSSGGSSTDFSTIDEASVVRQAYHVDGSGSTVAVIDTGVNYNHKAFGGGFGPGHKVVAGYDFADGSPDPIATSMMHGTAVAGIIASSDPSHPGIAPGADIAALKNLGDNTPGNFNKVADALRWVIDHHQDDNITAVNISLSDGNNYMYNWFAKDGGVGQRITDLIKQLDGLNIPVIAATGNNFDGKTQGEGFVAVVPDTISVTATDASDHLVSDAQRLGKTLGGDAATDIAAPGQGITAPSDGESNFATGDGTSFAAPQVSGAVVLLQQIYQSRYGTLPSVSDLDQWLKAGAVPVSDPVTGITIGRLDIAKAASMIPNPTPHQAAQENLAPPQGSQGSSGGSPNAGDPGSQTSTTTTSGQSSQVLNAPPNQGSQPTTTTPFIAPGSQATPPPASGDQGSQATNTPAPGDQGSQATPPPTPGNQNAQDGSTGTTSGPLVLSNVSISLFGPDSTRHVASSGAGVFSLFSQLLKMHRVKS